MKKYGTLFLVCAALAAGCQNEEPKPVDRPHPAAPSVGLGDFSAQWPADAHYAVCSDDGRTVAVTSGTDLVVLRDGKEISRIDIRMKSPTARLNKDGSRLVAFSLKRNCVVLWNVNENVEVATFKGRHGGYKFSNGGRYLAVEGVKDVKVYWASDGEFSGDAEVRPDEYLEDFHFANVGNTDDDTALNLVTADGGVRQFERNQGIWSERQVRHWAAEDQGFDPWIRD